MPGPPEAVAAAELRQPVGVEAVAAELRQAVAEEAVAAAELRQAVAEEAVVRQQPAVAVGTSPWALHRAAGIANGSFRSVVPEVYLGGGSAASEGPDADWACPADQAALGVEAAA